MNKKTEPKYLKVVHAIKKQIADNALCIGDRLQSENELSHFFGLSRQTVRQATSILESEGILERRRGSGTYVASARIVPHAATMNIGVITTYLDDYIFPSVIQGIDRILTQNGYSMQLSITYNKVENETKILEALLERGVDGLIIEPTKSGLPNLNMDLYKQIKRQGIPCVFIHACYQEMSFPYVAMDDFMCGKAAADYLVQKNHSQIAAVLKSDDMQGHLRYAGYASELKKNKLLLREERIVWFTTEDLDIEFAEHFEQQVFKRLENCTAVVCYNDQIALRVMKVLVKNHKRIPLDVSVISFDNSNLATMGPVGLTTFSHPKEELGKVAAENLMKLIKSEPCDIAVKFKPELVERGSVCKI
ncbi:GntR family transcriptional regulator of arabinose operon [Sporomusaceae bacterium BoRhaA]|uniref:GntR family transcriptional regulator n=1 Tax=Pelorhabdus rhamnosifermentans TaxID=2772457 RepID=UPI001C0626CE|nr:GntR family transcriptional regulator [Pelorhabdus rhamnosifermentans]MBU2702743.1 GntR family transcriptional regulator of arabinose operon [Pelorhabdus rhamnosifermentans]